MKSFVQPSKTFSLRASYRSVDLAIILHFTQLQFRFKSTVVLIKCGPVTPLSFHEVLNHCRCRNGPLDEPKLTPFSSFLPSVHPATRNRMHQLKRCNLGYFLVLGCRHAAISVRPTKGPYIKDVRKKIRVFGPPPPLSKF